MLPPAIAALAFVHFLALETESVAERPDPPSLPIQIFWEYEKPRKERKLEVTCSGEKELIQYMLVKPHLCHQEQFTASSPTSPAQCISSIACKNHSQHFLNNNKTPESAFCSSSTEILCCLDPKSCDDQEDVRPPCLATPSTQLQLEMKEMKMEMKQGLPCKFPFVYQNETFNECTAFADKDCDRWCSLATRKGNQHVPNAGLWGHCLSDSPFMDSCPYRNATEEADTRKRYYLSKKKKVKPSKWGPCRHAEHFPRFRLDREKYGNKTDIMATCPTVESTSYSFPCISASHKCSFPFYYNSVKYDTCISLDDPDCRLWCSTENDGGIHRPSTSLWAYCSKTCPAPKQPNVENQCKSSVHHYEDEFPGFIDMESEDPEFDYFSIPEDEQETSKPGNTCPC